MPLAHRHLEAVPGSTMKSVTDKTLPMPDMKPPLAGYVGRRDARMSSPPFLSLLVSFANLDGFLQINVLELGLRTSLFTTAICGC
jgi:hypothetical protein